MKTLATTLILGLVLFAQAVRAQHPAINPHAEVLADFKKRIDAYVDLRKKIDDGAPPLKKTDEPADIRVAQEALAARIRAGRADAKPGDIFTPAIAAELKRLVRPEIKEKGAKEVLKEDKLGPIPFKVNASYPDKEPLLTVQPNVLANLPTLPKDIDYRFVGKHLILRDSRANLIIDYLLNAIP